MLAAPGVEVGVPIFPSLGVANVVLKLTLHEANDVFFREVRACFSFSASLVLAWTS